MLHIGVDVHKKTCVLVAKTTEGQLVEKMRFPNEPTAWKTTFARFPAKTPVAVECVGFYQPILELLEQLQFDVKLVDARKVRLIATSKKKTDHHDANTLCDLLRSGFLPTSHVPSRKARDMRELSRALDRTVKDMTAVKNRIHRLFERAWVETPDVSDLFGDEGRAWLETVALQPVHRLLIDLFLKELDTLLHAHADLLAALAFLGRDDEDVDTMLSANGVGLVTALTLKAEIDDVSRFPNRKTIRANYGLAVSVRDSADTQHRGRITKQGPGVVRKVLVQAAIHHGRSSSSASVRFKRLAVERGKGVALVATAADLLDQLYQMLKTRTPSHQANAVTWKRKRADLARLATRGETLLLS